MKHIVKYKEFVNEDILNAPNQKSWSTKFSINYDDLPPNLNLTTAYLDKLLKGIPYQHYAFPEVSDDGALLFKTSQDLIKAQQRLNTVKESFHNIVESKIGDIYIMAGEAPNFPTFMKEFVKEYGEVKGSKEEKDLNTWLKSVWDERPTNESTEEVNKTLNESTDITDYYKFYNKEVKNAAKALKDIVSGYNMRVSYDTELYDAIIELVDAVKADRDNEE
jgi:hypothetical protein